MTDRSSKRYGILHRFTRWLFGAPFSELPAEFGDTVPADLRVFEAQAEEIQHHSIGHVASQTSQSKPTRPAQRGARTREQWLERS
jgi:hypothetical protein